MLGDDASIATESQMRKLRIVSADGRGLPPFHRLPHLRGMTPSMTCDQEEGLHAVQRPEHRMAGAARQQVDALLRCELAGFVARGIEVAEGVGDAAVLAGRMDG